MITPMTTPMTTPSKDRSAATFQAPETLQPSLDRNKVNPSGETPAAKLNHTPHGGTQDFEPGLGIPDDLAPGIRTAALRSGMRYESFVQQLVSCAFSQVKYWQQSDVERLFWLADRLGLDPLERDLIALEQRDSFPASVAFMITLDGWVKLLHRHLRFRGLSFEEGPNDEHGMPLWGHAPSFGRALPVLGLSANGPVSIAACMRAGSITQGACCATRHSPNAQGLPWALAGAFGRPVVNLKAASVRKPRHLRHLITTYKKTPTSRQTQSRSRKP